MKFVCDQNITWCPGCPDYVILYSFAKVLEELEKEGKIDVKKVVIVCGIGCHGKIFDYLNLSGFNALHGRAIPTAIGVKLANRDLKVVCFVGDGDTYAEGLDHLINAARYNADIKVFVHNNQNFALTTGQSTPTSQKQFKSKVRPEGEREEPLNPIALMLATKASFVARAFTLEFNHMQNIMKEAILHKGFSFVDILQPCIVFNNNTDFIKNHCYKVEKTQDFNEALKLAFEWNYDISENSRIPIGIFWKTERETFEEKEEVEVYWKKIRNVEFHDLLERFYV
jgi:2-oxoglutarate/2-oxoacid ferredoxin oxidoreductase subunit beta